RALLAEGARHIVVIERDTRCLAALEELAARQPGRLRIIEGDALSVDPAPLTERPRKIVANLPYNIATALLLRWLGRIGDYESLTLMFQREVAERLVAAPRSPAYGRLSVIVQWLCEAKILFDLPPRAFVPPPKVTSTLVSLTPRRQPLAPASKSLIERVTAAAFGQRRKMLRASLKTLGVPLEPLFAQTDIAPTARAEELSVEDFCALARALEDLRADGIAAHSVMAMLGPAVSVERVASARVKPVSQFKPGHEWEKNPIGLCHRQCRDARQLAPF